MATVKELMDIDINDLSRMTESQLRKVVGQMASAANRRLASLEKTETGKLSPAYQSREERGRFSTAGKNLNQLRNEYKSVRSFLSAKTSTISGWNEVRTRTFQRIGGGLNDAETERRFWKAYRQLESSQYASVHAYGSTETQRLLRQEITEGGGGTIDDLVNSMIDRLDRAYEEQQMEELRESMEDMDDDDFFNIGWDDLWS